MQPPAMLLMDPAPLLGALLLAMAVDALFGDPRWLWRHLAHPVVGMGWIIARLEGRWLDPAMPAADQARRGLIASLLRDRAERGGCSRRAGTVRAIAGRLGGPCPGHEHPDRGARAVRARRSRGSRSGARTRTGSPRRGCTSSAAIRRAWTRTVSPGLRSNRPRRTSRTASSLPCSGACCSACRAWRRTRR